jgi:hypothetical protein
MQALTEHQPSVLISGGAKGVDSIAEEEAVARGIPIDIKRPSLRQWNGPGGFKERNARIAEACEHLVRIYDPDSGTYGSGWTADLAEKMGRGVWRVAVQAKEPLPAVTPDNPYGVPISEGRARRLPDPDLERRAR